DECIALVRRSRAATLNRIHCRKIAGRCFTGDVSVTQGIQGNSIADIPKIVYSVSTQICRVNQRRSIRTELRNERAAEVVDQVRLKCVGSRKIWRSCTASYISAI